MTPPTRWSRGEPGVRSRWGGGDTGDPSPTYWMCKSTWWTLIFIQEQILLREKEHGTFHTEQPVGMEETCGSVSSPPKLFSIRGPKCHP